MIIVKRIAKIVWCILLAIVFIASIISIASSVLQKKNGYSGAFGYTFEIIATDSMSGTLEVGDVAIGKVYNSEDMSVDIGTIITFKAMDDKGHAITKTHRVYDIKEEGTFGNAYFTRGDNVSENQSDAGFLLEEDIISVNVGKIPFVGKFVMMLKTTAGYVTLTVVIALYIIFKIFELINIFLNNKKKEMLEETQDAREKIIREYLASQEKNKEKMNDAPSINEVENHSFKGESQDSKNEL